MVSIGQSVMENVRIIYLNKKYHLIAEEVQNVGTSITTYKRKKALLKGATAIIIAHDHPSGDPKPSANDIEITKRLSLACDILGIEMLDHVIITAILVLAKTDCCSYKGKLIFLYNNFDLLLIAELNESFYSIT